MQCSKRAQKNPHQMDRRLLQLPRQSRRCVVAASATAAACSQAEMLLLLLLRPCPRRQQQQQQQHCWRRARERAPASCQQAQEKRGFALVQEEEARDFSSSPQQSPIRQEKMIFSLLSAQNVNVKLSVSRRARTTSFALPTTWPPPPLLPSQRSIMRPQRSLGRSSGLLAGPRSCPAARVPRSPLLPIAADAAAAAPASLALPSSPLSAPRPPMIPWSAWAKGCLVSGKKRERERGRERKQEDETKHRFPR